MLKGEIPSVMDRREEKCTFFCFTWGKWGDSCSLSRKYFSHRTTTAELAGLTGSTASRAPAVQMLH